VIIKRNIALNITFYIISITFYLFLSFIFYRLLLELNLYFLFITIPMLFLFTILSLSNILKLIITLFGIKYGQNDNDEIVESSEKIINYVNKVTRNTLIAIFITLLTSVMILDITICLIDQKITLLSISIVIWVLIYYSLFVALTNMIRQEVRSL